MLLLKKLFSSGKPAVQPELSDRTEDDTIRGLTPETVDRIMRAADSGDTRDQCRLALNVLEKNADIMQAMATRKNAVIGCQWHLDPGDQSSAAREAAERLEKILRETGEGDDVDSFEDLMEDLLGALLPGFAVSEILWTPGGGIAGFHHIRQSQFTFVDSFTPKLVTGNHPEGEVIDRRRIIYHKVRIHGSDPVRGGLIRPLAWLHCFKSVNEKDLLAFIERYGMPFIAGMVDPTTFEKEKNLLKRLILNFGSSGGGVFTKNVELKLLECTGRGEAFFQLLQYLEAAVNKVILGQTASSGESAGLSKGDAQSKVRQDILEADCRTLQRVINTQLIKPWTRYNCGEVAPPQLVIDCAAPEDSLQNANVIKVLHDAGWRADQEEICKKFSMKLTPIQNDAPAVPLDAAAPPAQNATEDSARTLNLKQKYDAMGVAIRAGLLTATPEIEAQTRSELGLPAMSPEVKKAWEATGGIRQPITLKSAESEAVNDALNVDDGKPQVQAMGAEDPEDSPVEKWLGPVARKIDALTAEDLSGDEFRKNLTSLANDAGFGDSGDFEDLLQNIICAGITAGYEKNRRKRR